MPKFLKEEFIAKTGKYFPPETIDFVYFQFETHLFNFRITRPRVTKKGDFRYSLIRKSLPSISINSNLCSYEFFLVFLHELAHYKVFTKFENQAKSHGKEWKNEYILANISVILKAPVRLIMIWKPFSILIVLLFRIWSLLKILIREIVLSVKMKCLSWIHLCEQELAVP